MKRRTPIKTWCISGPLGGAMLEGRTRGNAVKKYRRTGTLRTDPNTGGWVGVSAEVASVAGRREVAA